MERKKTLASALLLLFFGLLAGGSIITGELYELWFWGIGFVIICIIGIIMSSNRAQERKEKLDKANIPTSDFKGTVKIEAPSAEYSFAIDEEKRKIMIVTADNSDAPAKKHYIDFGDIISVELLEDSNIAFSKSTMRTIGGGLVGGAIAGGAGAVIGGLSGDSKMKKEVSKIEVKILLRNQSSPAYTIQCYNSGTPMDVSSPGYNIITKTAREIVDHISVIIDMMDREYQHQENMLISEPKTQSVADELEKLCALKDKGILSAEEFEKQKAKILS